MKWQAPDTHQKLPPRDDHRQTPLLPPIVVLTIALVVVCGVLGWLVLGAW